MEYTALIVAAGSGSRMGLGYNKLLYTFANGQTIIEKTTSIFLSDTRCKEIIMVISEEDKITFEKLFEEKGITFVIGGKTRQESVRNGLRYVQEEYVLIHDGARPWLSMDCLNRLLNRLEEVNACLLMVEVKDTIKEVVNGRVQTTLMRSHLRQAQTPQAFLTSLIQEGYEVATHSDVVVTDDASIIEQCMEEAVYEVEGDYHNRKVTTREDLEAHEEQ